MAGSKEIRTKIKSVQNTRKITKAMEMVAASKMRKAQERMRHARPLGRLVGPMKVQIAAFSEGRIGGLYIVSTRLVNTMKQEPVLEQLLPLPLDRLRDDQAAKRANWDYLYEPEARVVLEQLLTRYVEQIIYQAVAENIASEQSARMVAMKSASDNASSVIDDLTLIYNKSRQAAITKAMSEIVGGAAAV